MRKKIIIFGAGRMGKRAYQLYGSDLIAFYVDNASEKWGTMLYDKEIISPEKLKEIYKDYMVVIASIYEGEISEQLTAAGIEHYWPLGRYVDSLISTRRKLEDKNYGRISAIVEKEEPEVMKYHLMLFCHNDKIDWILYKDIESTDFSGYDAIFILDVVHHSEIRYYLELHKAANVVDFHRIERYCDTDELVSAPNSSYTSCENKDLDWADTMIQQRLPESVNSYTRLIVSTGNQPLFQLVEIETVNRCNGVCGFCPVNVNKDIREHKEMSDDLFHSIIDQLAELDYSGRISLFSNNEPFLDKKIVERQRFAREKLPNAKMHLMTNGTVLKVEQFAEIINYLDEMVIDNYNQNLQMIPSVKKIADYCEAHPELKKKVTICIRKPQELLSSRGGDAPNRTQFYTFARDSCALPFQQMVIRPDGKVSLCCNDPYGKMTLGDASVEKLTDIWNGRAYTGIRSLLIKGRENLKHCRNCDVFQIY